MRRLLIGWLLLCGWASVALAQMPPEAPAEAPARPASEPNPTSVAVTATPPIATELPPLPARMPDGYTAEMDGAVRWIYPTSASDEVGVLIGRRAAAWAELASAFGAELSPTLDVRVALSPEQMQDLAPAGSRLPGYASGVAFPSRGLILLTLTAPGTWRRPDMDAVFVHELSHVALHRAVGGHATPRWFTEGVSVHMAQERTIERIRRLWDGSVRGELIAFDQLRGGFPVQHGRVDLAYAQSADFVRHLLDTKEDARRFRKLVKGMREGSSFDDALLGAYHVTAGFMEREWRTELQRRYGRWPSLLMGFTGLGALSVLLLVAGYVRARRRHHSTLKRWAIEEAPLQDPNVPADAELVFASPSDRGADAETPPGPRDSSVPTVEHDGDSHTLH